MNQFVICAFNYFETSKKARFSGIFACFLPLFGCFLPENCLFSCIFHSFLPDFTRFLRVFCVFLPDFRAILLVFLNFVVVTNRSIYEVQILNFVGRDVLVLHIGHLGPEAGFRFG